jgi:hypothetical protein
MYKVTRTTVSLHSGDKISREETFFVADRYELERRRQEIMIEWRAKSVIFNYVELPDEDVAEDVYE